MKTTDKILEDHVYSDLERSVFLSLENGVLVKHCCNIPSKPHSSEWNQIQTSLCILQINLP